MTPDELSARTQRAIAAATRGAGALGLEVREAIVLHDVFSLVVHLAPLPVVARVPLVLPPGLRGEPQLARMRRELDAVSWLAARGFPVVAPTSLVPLEPVEQDGFAITFWDLADVSADHVPYSASDTALTAQLHSALRDYPAELPFLSPVAHTVPGCIGALQQSPELMKPTHLDRLKREWEVLRPLLTSEIRFLARFPQANVQAVHGDAPSNNAIRTTSGVRMADFEDVTRAPVEWDLAFMPEEEIAKYDAEAERLGLQPADREVLGVMNAARMLQMVASVALVPELPVLAEELKPALEMWMEMPFAAGLA